MPGDLAFPDDGKLAANIVHFARALRKAGLPVGPGRVADAIRAVEAAGFSERTDFYWTLHACFVSRPEHRTVFAQVFRLFWRDPQFLEHMMSMLLPMLRGAQEEHKARDAERRAAEALLDGAEAPPPKPSDEEETTEIEVDATLTFSADEQLKQADFEQMSAEETRRARIAIARMQLPVKPIASRRTRTAALGRYPDWRGTMRAAMRTGGDIRTLKMRQRTVRWPNLVVLCDISGSMSAYSRMLLHFLHSAANAKGVGWAKVYGFTFGTRLTNITRHLRQRDVDAALKDAGAEAQDWDAWKQRRLSPAEVLDTAGGNRMICHPYTKVMNSIIAVDQAAAVLLTTVGRARELGIDEERWVYLRGSADACDTWYLGERARLHESPALRRAAASAFSQAGFGAGDVDMIELYSCFPSAVQVACREIGVALDDPRGLTVTGGMSLFGGPGNSYTLHGIATVCDRLREAGRGSALVTANGGYLTKHSVGVYAREAGREPWAPRDTGGLQARVEPEPEAALTDVGEGAMTLVAHTVRYSRGEPQEGIAIGELASGERCVATSTDPETLQALLAEDCVSKTARVTHEEGRNEFRF